MEPDDSRESDYLLPEGCKDLIDAWNASPHQWPKRHWLKHVSNLPPICGEVVIPTETSATKLAALLNQQPSRIVAEVMQLGISVTADQPLDFWIILIVARRHGFIAERAEPQPQRSDLCDEQKLNWGMEHRKQRLLAQVGKRAVYRGARLLVPVTIKTITIFPDYFSAELVAIDGISLCIDKTLGKLCPAFSVGSQWQLVKEEPTRWRFAVAGCRWQVFLDEAKCDAIVQFYKQNTEMDPDLLFKHCNYLLYPELAKRSSV
jgi:hypothetical protein